MPLSLGASLNDPSFVFVQILFAQSSFFLVTGAAATLSIWALPTLDYFCGVYPVTGLQVAIHIVTLALFGAVIAFCVERHKLCLDFVITTFVMYLVFCCLITGFPSGLKWWMSTSVGFSLCYCVARQMCLSQEMQEVELKDTMAARRSA